ncbi:MAG: aldo/keto reductase [Dehalococcoidia bacterium]
MLGAASSSVPTPIPAWRRCAARWSTASTGSIRQPSTATGDGQSETNLGHILKELNANPNISTKMRIGPEHVGDIMGEMQRSMEASLERLQRDRVDVIYLHTPVTRERGAFRGSLSIDDVMGDRGIVAGFESIKGQGLAGNCGFAGFGDTDCLHQMVASGHFQAVLAYYNLLNPSAGRRVPKDFSAHDYRNLIGLASEHGLGVHCIRALAGGAVAGLNLEGNNVLSPGSTGPADLSRTDQVQQALGVEAAELPQTALRFALMQPGISGVLVGFAELEHIDQAIAAAEMGPLSEEAVGRLEELYATDFGNLK